VTSLRTVSSASLAVCIANWDGADHLAACLASIERHSAGVQLRVIVVDNGSRDNSLQVVRDWSNRLPIEVIALTRNSGYARANNLAFELVQEDFCLFLNNDATVVEPLAGVAGHFSRFPRLGIAQGMQLTPDGATLDSLGSWFTTLGFLVHPYRGLATTSAPEGLSLFSVKGAALYARTQCLREVGMFDERFFAYWEESDLCWRALIAGWDVHYSRELPAIRHVGGATSERLGPGFGEYHSYRNRLRAICVNADRRTLALMLPLHVGCCLAAASAALVAKRPQGARAVGRALAWNVQVGADTVRRRRQVQSLRQLSDRAALRGRTAKVQLSFLKDGLAAYATWRLGPEAGLRATNRLMAAANSASAQRSSRPRQRVPALRGAKPATPPRMVSVTIPTMNSAATLRWTLESVARSAAAISPLPVEVVVADSRSSDATLEVARDFGATIVEDAGRLLAARRAAVEATRGDVILVIDSDQVLTPDALQRCVESIAHGADYLFLGERVHDPHTFIQKLSDQDKQLLAYDIDGQTDPDTGVMLPRAFRADLLRDAYAAIGRHLDDVVVAQDHAILHAEVRRLSDAWAYVADSVRHIEPDSLMRLWSKNYRYGWSTRQQLHDDSEYAQLFRTKTRFRHIDGGAPMRLRAASWGFLAIKGVAFFTGYAVGNRRGRVR
jgi:GT2 family glycosyltransferase